MSEASNTPRKRVILTLPVALAFNLGIWITLLAVWLDGGL